MGTAQPVRSTCSDSSTSTVSSPPSRCTVTGESPPRTTCATAAPLAPVPLLSVSPTPRSKIRARIASGATRSRTTRWCGSGRSARSRSPARALAGRCASGSSTRIAHCGLPIATCWKRWPATSPRAVGRAAGVVRRVQRGAAHVHAARRRAGDRRPDLARQRLDAERVCSVQPLRRRYRIASRAPLPDSSASLPSGLKIRSRATKPGSSGLVSSRTPSAPGPKCGSHSRLTCAGVSSTSSKMR